MGYAEDMSQLALVAAVGGGTGGERAARLQGAVERLNTAAKNLRTIVADVEWDGEAALAARDAFQKLAGTLNEHADAVNAIATADAGTDEPFDKAAADYRMISELVDDPGSAYYDQAGRSFDEYRADLAKDARAVLQWKMSSAGSAVRAAASWDLEVPPAGTAPGGTGTGGGGLTGTVPPGSSSPPAPGGFDPVGPVTGTVPAGSSSPTGSGGFDPVGPVTGTVPAGSSSPAGSGGFDPVGPVTGTVPAGSSSPTGSGGFDPVGPVTGTTDPLTHPTSSLRDVPAELRQRLGG